ncbi:leucine-rich repeat domain-containing protein [Acetivibrio thermocellus]|uniref:leucine-rich repeat domain-containing protein n=1 Tax=Acetivibrio thermocellus TaxID=1515 RepID=UPI00003C8FD2
MFSLETLYLSNNKIRDISPIQNFINIESLELENNKIKDISFLKELTQLNNVNLENNQNPIKTKKYDTIKKLEQLGVRVKY